MIVVERSADAAPAANLTVNGGEISPRNNVACPRQTKSLIIGKKDEEEIIGALKRLGCR